VRSDGLREMTYTSYCPHCDAERPIQETVPWQEDFCRECGNEISEATIED
jgi:uncharacterized protein (DUF983 family)